MPYRLAQEYDHDGQNCIPLCDAINRPTAHDIRMDAKEYSLMIMGGLPVPNAAIPEKFVLDEGEEAFAEYELISAPASRLCSGRVAGLLQRYQPDIVFKQVDVRLFDGTPLPWAPYYFFVSVPRIDSIAWSHSDLTLGAGGHVLTKNGRLPDDGQEFFVTLQNDRLVGHHVWREVAHGSAYGKFIHISDEVFNELAKYDCKGIVATALAVI